MNSTKRQRIEIILAAEREIAAMPDPEDRAWAWYALVEALDLAPPTTPGTVEAQDPYDLRALGLPGPASQPQPQPTTPNRRRRTGGWLRRQVFGMPLGTFLGALISAPILWLALCVILRALGAPWPGGLF